MFAPILNMYGVFFSCHYSLYGTVYTLYRIYIVLQYYK